MLPSSSIFSIKCSAKHFIPLLRLLHIVSMSIHRGVFVEQPNRHGTFSKNCLFLFSFFVDCFVDCFVNCFVDCFGFVVVRGHALGLH